MQRLTDVVNSLGSFYREQKKERSVWRTVHHALQCLVWWRIFEAMSDDPDFEYLIVDSTIVRAHQHAAGAKKGRLKIKRKIKRSAARAGA
jgi:hypothetical protein